MKEPLSRTHPQIAVEWHPSKNRELTPDMVLPGSGKKVWCKSKILLQPSETGIGLAVVVGLEGMLIFPAAEAEYDAVTLAAQFKRRHRCLQ